jgi:two-component system, LytTR family, response regulator
MRVVIIEDESFATKRLETMIHVFDESIEVIAKLESVKESVAWFSNNIHPDLIFLDIQLEDDLSFSIFERVNIDVPIIFTTAFDEFAIKAFELKSIDYLLKPIIQEDLNKAILKYKNWSIEKSPLFDTSELIDLLQLRTRQFRERFSVSVGEKLKTFKTEDIAYFFSTAGITFVVLNTKSQYSMDLSLDALAGELNPKYFYRVNRQYLVRLSAISNVHIFPKSRLKLELNPKSQDEIFVSLDKVSDFKRWLDGEN